MQHVGYPREAVRVGRVCLQDSLWSPRIETNRSVTVRYCLQRCAESGHLGNFAKAAGRAAGGFEGEHCYIDSDVYKIIEGAAYILEGGCDEDLWRSVDVLIEDIVNAQENDGYLYTGRTIDPTSPGPGAGPERWAWLHRGSHDSTWQGTCTRRPWPSSKPRVTAGCSTQRSGLMGMRTFWIAPSGGTAGATCLGTRTEVELGLARLCRATGDGRYLRLARYWGPTAALGAL
ncbi:unnamed protein product [Prorocentrum cordatum]|uniref:Non-reducing end beta-L-arabinofuranosidase-like GH127 catalytic domain-containing protein n=1 Tax=Prorocentrum cordatum TaxID=2364126 RepID=A0ABN9V541_9DINO|nr:unnamed protein product [Polarella glacialis]